MPSGKTLLQMAAVTAGVMLAANMVASVSPAARQIIRGTSVSGVDESGSRPQTILVRAGIL